MKIRKEKEFMSFFDETTGQYARTGIIKNGKDTDMEPFMASFPELLDVGIMGHCMHGQKGLCMRAGVECYQDGLHRKDANMSLTVHGAQILHGRMSGQTRHCYLQPKR